MKKRFMTAKLLLLAIPAAFLGALFGSFLFILHHKDIPPPTDPHFFWAFERMLPWTLILVYFGFVFALVAVWLIGVPLARGNYRSFISKPIWATFGLTLTGVVLGQLIHVFVFDRTKELAALYPMVGGATALFYCLACLSSRSWLISREKQGELSVDKESSLKPAPARNNPNFHSVQLPSERNVDRLG